MCLLQDALIHKHNTLTISTRNIKQTIYSRTPSQLLRQKHRITCMQIINVLNIYAQALRITFSTDYVRKIQLNFIETVATSLNLGQCTNKCPLYL